MCGILATLPKSEHNLFERALTKIAHRGPDSFGIWSEDDISLGHRRLSIIDTSNGGMQPMSCARNRYHIIFNGEIYNYLELKRELQSKGHTFTSESDTEVALMAYIEWGKDCLLKFNGMWAILIWDSQEKTLFVTRDRFGKKPLFYSQKNGRTVFASEMKAIFPFLDKVAPSTHFSWITQNIFSYESTDKCLIEGISRFPAGHYGYFKNNQLKIFRYWNTLDHLQPPPPRYEDQVAVFRELFIDSCRLRMRSDVPIGTSLSGGLDSSATIAVMKHLGMQTHYDKNNHPYPSAFVASFPGTPIDETKFAKIVTDHLGVSSKVIEIDPLKCWDKIDDYLYLFEELYITSPLPMIMTYGAVRKNGIKVTLDGHGADELFSGYGHLREAIWDNKFNLSRVHDILKVIADSESPSAQFKQMNYTREYLEFMFRKIRSKLTGRYLRSRDADNKNFHLMDNFTQELYIIFHETILPTLLRNYDRYSMINGVEIRMPFMDHRLVSFVFSLPATSKFGNGFTKKLIRDSVSDLLPAEIVYRKAKVGFNTPIVDWMQGPLKEYFLDTVHSADFQQCVLLENPGELKASITAITNKENNSWANAEQAWTKLTPYLWEKAVIKRPH